MQTEQKARNRDVSEGILRQRRNLLISSIILPLFFFSGAEIEKTNLLGTIIKIENPLIIKISLVGLFIYFLWRYWQYYLEETWIQDMHRTIKNYIYSHESKALDRKARKKASFLNQDILNVSLAPNKHSFGLVFANIPDTLDEKIGLFRRTSAIYIHPRAIEYGEPENQIKNYYKSLNEQTLWKPIYTSERKSEEADFHTLNVEYNILSFFVMRVYGFLSFIVKESYFTDYLLPFVVSLASIIATVCAIFI